MSADCIYSTTLLVNHLESDSNFYEIYLNGKSFNIIVKITNLYPCPKLKIMNQQIFARKVVCYNIYKMFSRSFICTAKIKSGRRYANVSRTFASQELEFLLFSQQSLRICWRFGRTNFHFQSFVPFML